MLPRSPTSSTWEATHHTQRSSGFPQHNLVDLPKSATTYTLYQKPISEGYNPRKSFSRSGNVSGSVTSQPVGEADKRSRLLRQYNDIANKYGIKQADRYPYLDTPRKAQHAAVKRSWFTRLLHPTSSNPPSEMAISKSERVPYHKHSFSDLTKTITRHHLNEPKLLDLRSMVDVGGESLIHLPPDFAPGPLLLPTCFRATIHYLMQNATTRGIFRIPGSVRVVNKLFDYYYPVVNGTVQKVSGPLRNEVPNDFDLSVHDVASTFKRLISVLPGGILGSISTLDALVAIHAQRRNTSHLPRSRSMESPSRLMALVLDAIPNKYRRDLIISCFGLLAIIGNHPQSNSQGVSSPSNPGASDSMSYYALGILFGPLLIGHLLDQYVSQTNESSSVSRLLPSSSRTAHRHRCNFATLPDTSNIASPTAMIHVMNDLTEMVIMEWVNIVRHLKGLTSGHEVKEVSASIGTPLKSTGISNGRCVPARRPCANHDKPPIVREHSVDAVKALPSPVKLEHTVIANRSDVSNRQPPRLVRISRKIVEQPRTLSDDRTELPSRIGQLNNDIRTSESNLVATDSSQGMVNKIPLQGPSQKQCSSISIGSSQSEGYAQESPRIQEPSHSRQVLEGSHIEPDDGVVRGHQLFADQIKPMTTVNPQYSFEITTPRLTHASNNQVVQNIPIEQTGSPSHVGVELDEPLQRATETHTLGTNPPKIPDRLSSSPTRFSLENIASPVRVERRWDRHPSDEDGTPSAARFAPNMALQYVRGVSATRETGKMAKNMLHKGLVAPEMERDSSRQALPRTKTQEALWLSGNLLDFPQFSGTKTFTHPVPSPLSTISSRDRKSQRESQEIDRDTSASSGFPKRPQSSGVKELAAMFEENKNEKHITHSEVQSRAHGGKHHSESTDVDQRSFYSAAPSLGLLPRDRHAVQGALDQQQNNIRSTNLSRTSFTSLSTENEDLKSSTTSARAQGSPETPKAMQPTDFTSEVASSKSYTSFDNRRPDSRATLSIVPSLRSANPVRNEDMKHVVKSTSTSSLHLQVRALHQKLQGKADEVSQLERLLEARKSSDISSIREQLQIAQLRLQESTRRTQAAEKRLETFEKFTTTLKGLRQRRDEGNRTQLISITDLQVPSSDPLQKANDSHNPVFNRARVLKDWECLQTKSTNNGLGLRDLGVVQAQVKKCLHKSSQLDGANESSVSVVDRTGIITLQLWWAVDDLLDSFEREDV